MEAENCVIEREGVVGLRRGFDRYGAAFTDPIAMGEFKDKLLVLDGTTLKYNDSGVSFTSWAGTFSPPDASTRVRFQEVRANLYFTTSVGLKKNDALSNDPVQAGMPGGLDMKLTKTGTGGGWFSQDSQVAYKLAWVREDANKYVIRGAPSFREFSANPNVSVLLNWSGGLVHVEHTAHGYSSGDSVTISGAGDELYEGTSTIKVLDADNYSYELTTAPSAGTLSDKGGSSGKAFNMQLEWTIPDEVVAGDRWELFRSNLSAGGTIGPKDQYFKIDEAVVTSGEITEGTIAYIDSQDSVFLGEELYTNATQETISQANDTPPFAIDFVVWKGYPWFANTNREHQTAIDLISLTGLSGATITFANPARTYTGAATEDISSQQFQVHSAESTTAANIRETAKSIIRTINRDSGQTDIYAYYISGVDDPPGKILIRQRVLNQTAFTVACSVDNFTPDINTTAVSSQDDAKINNLHRGKFEQPEATPRLKGSTPIGSEKFKIVRILALRDSLIILKEEGIWRVTGESETSFVYKQLDPSTRIFAPETAVVLDNAVYALTNQGVVKVSESGTSIISRPIEDEFKKVFSFAAFKTISHAISYESERKYILFTQDDPSDTQAQIAWVYDFITRAWTVWRKNINVGHVLFSEDKLYMVHGTDNFLLQERKSFGTTFDDFQDEEVPSTVATTPTTVTNSKGLVVTQFDMDYAYKGQAVTAGFFFKQGSVEGLIDTVATTATTDRYTVTLDETYAGITVAAATVVLAIPARIRWVPEDMGSPAMSKQVPYIQFYQERNSALHQTVSFVSDIDNSETMVDVELTTQHGWGVSEWGPGWGSEGPDASTPIRVPVPRNHQRCRTISSIYIHHHAKEQFQIVSLAVIYRIISDRTVRTPA